jgi:Flp pilus assembly protein TadD
LLELAPDDESWRAIALGNLGVIAKERGNIAEARRLWTEARNLFARVGMAPEVKQVESWLAGLAE